MKGVKYAIAVRELCAFTAKRGDLDLRFSPSPTAQEGIAGHQQVQSRRPAGYEAEIALSGEYCELLVRGRADGYDPAQNRLEEIKTHRGDLERLPDNHRHLHWAQLKVYGHLLCETRGIEELNLALVYFDIGAQKENLIVERHDRTALKAFFEDQCGRFLDWARQELAHREARDHALGELPFPYPDFRAGQRQLAEAVYKSAGSGHPLLAQAPTGIGKTVGTLFPMLKACARKGLDKVFFLTAKTPGRQVALHALDALRGGKTMPLRVLELVARDKACEHPDKACHGESCPLAKGFFDRLPQARSAALNIGIDGGREALRAVAQEHDVCPYFLAQDMARWADVVVADYNYYFDKSALLYLLALENEWKTGVLADEAHNLIPRARDMYSGALNQAAVRTTRQTAPPSVRKELDRLIRCWNELNRGQENAYFAYAELPGKFDGAVRTALSAMTEHFAENPQATDAGLQELYFSLQHFARLADTFGEHSLFDIDKKDEASAASSSSVVCIRNVVPAAHLAERFSKAAAVTLFSATLAPQQFYGDMLGLESPLWIDVESPFDKSQLQVHIARNISTRYQHRSASVPQIVELMKRQYAEAPGNYLAFFSSFDYLRQVYDALDAAEAGADGIPLWRQTSAMSEAERDGFLSRFAPGGRGIGFAVLGGAFGEGIDLPGDRLIGAFIATLGLPQVNPVNREMVKRVDAICGKGYDYIYHYPGLQKVVQAAGRVIRTREDRGTVHLMDDRFQSHAVRELMPKWWEV